MPRCLQGSVKLLSTQCSTPGLQIYLLHNYIVKVESPTTHDRKLCLPSLSIYNFIRRLFALMQQPFEACPSECNGLLYVKEN